MRADAMAESEGGMANSDAVDRSRGSVTCRVLGRDDHDEAVDLVAGAVMELPVYRWLCGEVLTEEVALWLAEARCATLEFGGVIGAFDDGRLCGVAVLALPGLPSPEPAPAMVDYTRRFAQEHPGFAQRYVEMGRSAEQVPVDADSVDVAFAVVAPDVRQTGVLSALGILIAEIAVERGLAVALRTTFPDHADMYRNKWGFIESATYSHPCGDTVWVFGLDQGQVRAFVASVRSGS